jgi:anti-anti-sigma factor
MPHSPVPGATSNRVEIVFHSPTVAIVSLIGEHDLSQHAMLLEALGTAAGRRRDVLVDLSRCEFLDSTVISLLLHIQDEVASGGGRCSLIVPDSSTHTARVFDVMHLGDALRIETSLDVALAGLEHSVRVRDRRARSGDQDAFVAECSCGWAGDPRTGVLGMRHARADATAHAEDRSPRTAGSAAPRPPTR